MAVPKRRTSRSRKGSRRSHHHAPRVQVQYCNRCNEPVLAHRVCASCGYSSTQDREIINMESKEGE